MKNKTEVIDGVKGEWRTVTKAEEVTFGQRVRYDGDKIGCNGGKRFIMTIEGSTVNITDGKATKVIDIFGKGRFFYDNVQAFFPIAKRQKREVARIDVFRCFKSWKWQFTLPTTTDFESCREYSTRTSAIRDARRFCKTIGFECEIIK